MELLVVAVIVVLLASFAAFYFREVRTRAYISRCKAQIAALCMAIDAYYEDWGHYPVSVKTFVGGTTTFYQHNGNDGRLVEALTNSQRGGPYIRFRKEDLVARTVGSVTDFYIVDPWGKEYVYLSSKPWNPENPVPAPSTSQPPYCNGPYYNKDSYDLYSFGHIGYTYTSSYSNPLAYTDWYRSTSGNTAGNINNWQ